MLKLALLSCPELGKGARLPQTHVNTPGRGYGLERDGSFQPMQFCRDQQLRADSQHLSQQPEE